MLDIGPNKVFKSAAFAPSDSEVEQFIRAQRLARRKLNNNSPIKTERKPNIKSPGSSSDAPPTSTPERKRNYYDTIELSDSDDELPDVSSLFDTRPAKKVKREVKAEVGLKAESPIKIDDVSLNLTPLLTC